MNVRRYLEIFILGHLSCLSDGAVTITTTNTLDNIQHLECGSSVTLKCDTPANTNDMSWQVDGALVADCIFGTCDAYPPFPGSYSFSYDQVNGVFNLTVSPVKITDNGRTFTCYVAPDSATFSPAVKELTADNSCSVTETAVSGSVTFVATTGCIYPESEVEIKWYYLETNGGSAVEVSSSDFGYTSTRTLDNSTCISGDCSSGTDVTVVSETTVFQVQSEGLEVFIQAKFIHSASSSATVFKSSTSKYKIKKASPEPHPSCCRPGEIVLIVISICYFIGVMTGIIKYLLQSKKLCDGLGKGNELNWWVVIPLCVIIVGFGIITVWAIWRLCCSGEGNGDVERREENLRHGLQRGNQPRDLPLPPHGARPMHGRDPSAIISNDKHPLDDTVTPWQKAGTLKSLHEGTGVEVQEKKKKKKKKKKKLQEDEI